MAPDQEWIATLCLVASSVIAVVANLLLILVFFKRRGLRTVSNRFIVNLLVTNLLSSLLIIPLLVLDQRNHSTINQPEVSIKGSSLENSLKSTATVLQEDKVVTITIEEIEDIKVTRILANLKQYNQQNNLMEVISRVDQTDINLSRNQMNKKEMVQNHQKEMKQNQVNHKEMMQNQVNHKEMMKNQLNQDQLNQNQLNQMSKNLNVQLNKDQLHIDQMHSNNQPYIQSNQHSLQINQHSTQFNQQNTQFNQQKIQFNDNQLNMQHNNNSRLSDQQLNNLNHTNKVDNQQISQIYQQQSHELINRDYQVMNRFNNTQIIEFNSTIDNYSSIIEQNTTDLSSAFKDISNPEDRSYFLCYFAQSSTSLVCTASIFSILLIGIDQYFAVIHSLRYHSYIDKSKSLVLILLSWFLAVIFAVFEGVAQKESKLWQFCHKTGHNDFKLTVELNTIYVFVYFVVVILLPFVAICTIYVCIYVAAHRSSERMRKSTSSQSSGNFVQQEDKEMDEKFIENKLALSERLAINRHLRMNEELAINERDTSEQLVSEQLRSEQLKSEQLRSEQLLSEQLRSEQLRSEKLMSEQLMSEQLMSEQLMKEQLKSEQLMSEQLMSEQLMKEQLKSEQLTNDQHTNEQLTNDQFTNEQLVNKQLTNEQLKYKKLINNKLINKQLTNTQFISKQLPNEQLPNEQLPNEQLPNEQFTIVEKYFINKKFELLESHSESKAMFDIEENQAESDDESEDEPIQINVLTSCDIPENESFLKKIFEPKFERVPEQIEVETQAHKHIYESHNAYNPIKLYQNKCPDFSHSKEPSNPTLHKVQSAPNFVTFDQLETEESSPRTRKVSRAYSERVTNNIFDSLRYKISNASIFRYREESRAAKISLLVVFMVLICYLPYGFALVLNTGVFDLELPKHFNYLSIILLVISNILSPFLFAYRNRRIQRELGKFLGLVSRPRIAYSQGLRQRKHSQISQKPNVFKPVELNSEVNEPFLTSVTESNEKKSILKRVYSKNWPSYKDCNFIPVPTGCIGEGRSSFSSASTQISEEI